MRLYPISWRPRTARRVGSRAPPLRYAERFEPDLPCPGPSQEDTGVFEGELLARLPPLELGMMRVGVGGRVEAEDDMVHRDAQVESAFGVEVDDLIRGYWRDFLVDVTEGAAVSHRLNVGLAV